MHGLLLSVSVLALAACSQPTSSVSEVAKTAEAVPAAATPSIAIGGPNPAIPAIIAPGAVPALIAGKWVSIDDDKSSITLTADGKWTDDYVGEADAHDDAAWRAITGVEAKAALPTYEFTPEATYLEVKRSDSTFYYELGDLDAENLDMFYVGRGNRLAYTRAK